MASRRRKAAPRRSPRAARRSRRTPVDRLRAICLALPETTEKLAWSEPTWRVRGRLFAQLDDHHHGADHLAVWLPAPLGEQEAMIFTDPARFFRPPYVGVRGWVGVRIDGAVDWAVVSKLVAQAYAMVAPPRLRAVKDAADAGGGTVCGRCGVRSGTCRHRSRPGPRGYARFAGSRASRPRSRSG